LEIHRATLDTCAQATGTVVVIDVLRAFTTAAFAFAAGAADITLVGAIEEAFALRERNPDLLLAGEVYGLPIESFDYGNSPSAFLDADLSGRRLVQRTSAGTQGVVRSQNADTLLASSLCCARATVDTIRRHPGAPITLVITGARPDDPADEDAACADYLEALLTGQEPDRAEIVRRVRESQVAAKFLDPADPRFPSADLDCAVNIDRFDFALPVRRQEGQLVMEPGPHSPALVAQAQVCPAASTGDLAFSTARHAGHGPAASICHSVKLLCTRRGLPAERY
jgi:2-phosphosulfolactate phosphatase